MAGFSSDEGTIQEMLHDLMLSRLDELLARVQSVLIDFSSNFGQAYSAG